MGKGLCVTIPVNVKQHLPSAAPTPIAQATATPLQCAVARAYRWRQALEAGQYRGIHDLAAAVECDPSYVARVLNLALLAPPLVEAILAGGPLADLPLSWVPKALPIAWPAQTALLTQRSQAYQARLTLAP
jgi:hypothetical protein